MTIQMPWASPIWGKIGTAGKGAMAVLLRVQSCGRAVPAQRR